MTALMNRWSIDGRDPNSYAGYMWVLGKYDRPWPERPVYGTVRSIDRDTNKVVLEIAPGTAVTVHLQTVTTVVEDETVPAAAPETEPSVIEPDAPGAGSTQVDPVDDDVRRDPGQRNDCSTAHNPSDGRCGRTTSIRLRSIPSGSMAGGYRLRRMSIAMHARASVPACCCEAVSSSEALGSVAEAVLEPLLPSEFFSFLLAKGKSAPDFCRCFF